MRDLAAMKAAGTSIMDKLKATARAQDMSFDFLMRKFAVERLAARINASQYANSYCFKGGMIMLRANPAMPRTTEDLDFTALNPFTKENLLAAFREIAATVPEQEDGFVFSLDEQRAARDTMMREDRDNPGFRMYFDVRVETIGHPAKARVKVDGAYGEVIVPEPVFDALTPTLRGWDPPVVPMYPWATVLAEKIHTIAKQGRENIRLRDFYDVLAITRGLRHDGQLVITALRSTYGRRASVPLDDSPVGLTPDFAVLRQADWTALMKKNVFRTKIDSFPEVVAEAAAFARPILAAAMTGGEFRKTWIPGSGWVPNEPELVPGQSRMAA